MTRSATVPAHPPPAAARPPAPQILIETTGAGGVGVYVAGVKLAVVVPGQGVRIVGWRVRRSEIVERGRVEVVPGGRVSIEDCVLELVEG